jgi:DNA polymerase-3 subunit alpha
MGTALRVAYEKTYLRDTRPVYIAHIEELGEDDCYDVQMEDQDSPYFLANGIVTHNCFQEQVMEVAREIAGYDMAQADNLRKVMGKKQKEKIKDEGIAFVKSAVANGIDEHVASEIFKFVEPFAGYGFNKSHAAAYGWISYQTAYLSANYPLQYLAALMSSIDKTDKLVEYIEETRRRGIPVNPPDINASQLSFAVDHKAIRFGLGSIKGMQGTSLDGILTERESGGEFASIFDLVSRTRIRNVARKTIETLVKVGACDNLPGNRAQKVAALEHAFNRANREIEDALSGQMNFFGGVVEEITVDILPNVPRASRIEELNWERDGLGIFVSGHPVDSVAHHVKRRRAITVMDAKKLAENTTTVIVGMVGVIRRIITKAGKNMLVCGLEDRTGTIELVVYSSEYENYHDLFTEGAILAVNGQIKTRQQINNDDDDAAQRSLVLKQADEILRAGFGHSDLETDAVA